MRARGPWTSAGELLGSLSTEKDGGDPLDALMALHGSARLCETTPAMELVGMRPLPVMVTFRHLGTMLRADKRDIHLHGMDPETVMRLGTLLERPAAVMDPLGSSSRDDTVVFLLDEVDALGDPIIAVIKPGGRSALGKFGPVVESNHLCSAYGRRDADLYLRRMRREGNFLYIDGERLGSLAAKTGVDVMSAASGLERDRMLRPSAVIGGRIPPRSPAAADRPGAHLRIADEVRLGRSFFVPERHRYLLSLMRDGRGCAYMLNATVGEFERAQAELAAAGRPATADEIASGDADCRPVGRELYRIPGNDAGLLRSAAREVAKGRWIPVSGTADSLLRAAGFLTHRGAPGRDEGLDEIEIAARCASAAARPRDGRAHTARRHQTNMEDGR